MASYCCCLGDEIEGDNYSKYPNKFQVGMCEAPCRDCSCFCAALFCPMCTQIVLRKKALGGDWSKYKCCQGYFDFACFKSGECGEKSCPICCMCLEAWCCLNLAVSSTRMYVMDQRQLHSDPCDRRIIRCNNCLQLLSCICNCLAIFIEALRPCARCIRCIANCTFWTVQGCMSAQVNYELEHTIVTRPDAAMVNPTVVVMMPAQQVKMQ